jgi:hypothetical protein
MSHKARRLKTSGLFLRMEIESLVRLINAKGENFHTIHQLNCNGFSVEQIRSLKLLYPTTVRIVIDLAI